ncbi:MAG: alpha-amylase family glycosyl hydrolase, partial [Candidatus Izemoplasmatales bacterium]
KKSLLLIVLTLLVFTFYGCNLKTTTELTTDQTTSGVESTTTELNATSTEQLLAQEPTALSGYLTSEVQDGTILHAWNWSMSVIENHLEEIAIAGFSTIQISPMQPQKDFFGIATWGATWWKLYQPLAFSIATENHSLGNKADLESLTLAADEFGIKIIVDVVANHLAGGDNLTLNTNVSTYETEIYDQGLIRQDNGYASDTSIFTVTRGSLGGFPDLQTDNLVVQERVLSLLKEYVDAGVDGFRFDAAKHIETPEDGTLASNFWPFVINGVKTYAEGKGIDDLYFYGEILNTPGPNREFSDYTPYMSITANNLSDTIRQAIISKNVTTMVNASYISGVSASETVLWAESHDNYAGEPGTTTSTPNSYITKTYVIHASRKDATTLYFARPNSNTFMGEVGSYLWQSQEVAEANRFHNYFVGAEEYLSGSNGFFLNERYDANRFGVVIVDLNGTKNMTDIPVYNLPDGSYHDQISESTFVVENGEISGTVGNSGVAIVYNNPYQPKPAVYVSDDGLMGSFETTKTVKVYSYNATEAYYSINGGTKVAFDGVLDVVLSHPEENAVVTLDIEAHYDDYVIERQYSYVKSNIVITEIVVNNILSSELEGNTVVAWVWPEGVDGRWVTGVLSGSTLTFPVGEEDDYYLLVTFPSGTTAFNWNDKIKQTQDIAISGDGTYDGSSLSWN